VEEALRVAEGKVAAVEGRLQGGALDWDALEFATVAEIAEKYLVSTASVRSWCRDGRLPSVMLWFRGRREYRIPKWWLSHQIVVRRDIYERIRGKRDRRKNPLSSG
jgi:hypothetical protein